MRELIDLIKLLEDGEEPAPVQPKQKVGAASAGADGVKAKGLLPAELAKRDNFQTFITKISKGLPFIFHPTGEEVYIKRSEARRMQQLLDSGQLKGSKITILTNDGKEINLSDLRKTEEFGGSSKENLKLKPANIGITDKDIPATDLYEVIESNRTLSETDYGQVVKQLAQYIVSGEYVQLPPEYTAKDKESERKGIVDYAGEYLGVLALLYNRSRFPRKKQFDDWLGGDLGEVVLKFPAGQNVNLADSHAVISNRNTSHTLYISSKGTGGGAAPAISGLVDRISDDIRRNPKLKNAVALIDLCKSERSAAGPSTVIQAFKIMDLIYKVNPNSISKQFHKFLPFESRSPRLMQQSIDSITNETPLPAPYQKIISTVNSDKATDGGKMVYLIKKEIADAVNTRNAIPEFKDTILQVLSMNFIQQYTDYNPNGELTFATQWPANLEGVITLENKSSALEPSSAGFSFKLGRNEHDYEDPGPDGVSGNPISASDIEPEVDVAAQDIVNPRAHRREPEPQQTGGTSNSVGRELRESFRKKRR